MGDTRAKTALDLTARIIDETGPRLAGSEACKVAAARLEAGAAELGDSSRLEPFTVHPGAFLGFIRVLVVLYALAAPLAAFLPWASALLSGLGLAILVFQFFLYKEVIDPFYPAREGLNAVGVLEPTGEAKRQLIVSGHHDSARIFNFYVDRPELFARRINLGIGSIALLFAASLALALASAPAAPRIAAAALFLLGLVPVLPLWRFASKEGTPGAGDNLASSAAALEVLRALRESRDSGSGLGSTRVVFASFDAEEAGLRGARAFARSRRAEFAALPSFAFNMDCVYRKDSLFFLSSDLNGSVRLDPELAELCVALAAECGASAELRPIAFLTGGTDAAELAKAGVRAASLLGMEWSGKSRASAYHTPADTIDAVEPAAIEAAISIALRLARELDSGRLDPAQDRGDRRD
jgi:aminopeptidase YwaD